MTSCLTHWGQDKMAAISQTIFIPSASTKLKGGYTGITLSVCPSVRPSVRLSVCGQNRVRSVSSAILIGSISYLHILSSNFRRCVACNARFKIQKFFRFVTLTLSSFDLGSNMTQWYGWSWGGGGYPQNASVLVVLVSNAFSWMEIYELGLKFHWSLFLRVQLTMFQHWFR